MVPATVACFGWVEFVPPVTAAGSDRSPAPMSQASPFGRVTPRWSLGVHGKPVAAASIAGLPGRSCIVGVSPPWSPSGPRSGSVWMLAEQPATGGSGNEMLWPPSVFVPAHWSPWLFATIVLTRAGASGVPTWNSPAPDPAVEPLPIEWDAIVRCVRLTCGTPESIHAPPPLPPGPLVPGPLVPV